MQNISRKIFITVSACATLIFAYADSIPVYDLRGTWEMVRKSHSDVIVAETEVMTLEFDGAGRCVAMRKNTCVFRDNTTKQYSFIKRFYYEIDGDSIKFAGIGGMLPQFEIEDQSPLKMVQIDKDTIELKIIKMKRFRTVSSGHDYITEIKYLDNGSYQAKTFYADGSTFVHVQDPMIMKRCSYDISTD